MKSARGTWTFVADGPEGPFRPASKRPIPPEGLFTLDGSLAFALHTPNTPPRERPKFFDVVDTGDTLEIVQ